VHGAARILTSRVRRLSWQGISPAKQRDWLAIVGLTGERKPDRGRASARGGPGFTGRTPEQHGRLEAAALLKEHCE